MDLKETWERIAHDKLEKAPISQSEIEKAITSESIGLMSKLRKKILHKFYWIIFFMLIFAVMIFLVPYPLVKVLLVVLWAAYVIGMALTFKEYRFMQQEDDMGADIKQALVNYHSRLTKFLKHEEYVGLALYPISVTAGFFLGYFEGKEEAIVDTKSLIALPIVILVVTPLCHWLAKWMNRYGFKKHMDKLKENIELLQDQS
ncbi:MAG: hypothetical protein AAFX87_17800 [Bacteroidota bacterium]